MHVRSVRVAVWAGVLVAVTTSSALGQGSSGEPLGSAVPGTSPGGGVGLTLVALGDSWPAGGHCDGCRSFMGRYADDLAATRAVPVRFVDLTESVVPGTTLGQTPASLLDELQRHPTVREAVASADIVVVSDGLNLLDSGGWGVGDGGALDAYLAGTCGGADDADCFRALGPVWRSAFDAILAEIRALRDGRPTAIRMVTAENLFISDPGLVADLGPAFGPAQGRLIVDTLAAEMCAAAARAGAVCIDARPILNGPGLDQRVDENSPESHQAISDALVASGLPELEGP